jgi:hypothetical protein
MAGTASKRRAGIAVNASGIGIAKPVEIITSLAAAILLAHTMVMANMVFPTMSGTGKEAIGCGIR